MQSSSKNRVFNLHLPFSTIVILFVISIYEVCFQSGIMSFAMQIFGNYRRFINLPVILSKFVDVRLRSTTFIVRSPETITIIFS